MAIKKAAKRFLTTATKGPSVLTKRTTVAKKKPSVKTLGTIDIDQMIREQAYKLYEKRGYRHGCDVDDWLEAERLVRRG